MTTATSELASPARSASSSRSWSAWIPLGARRALAVACAAMLVETLLWLLLYFRPTPFGRPFALDPAHYVFHAVFYGAWAHAVLALPFVAWGSLRRDGAPARLGLQLALTFALLVVGVVDREVQRFMGMHASLSWLETYGAVDRTPGVIWLALAGDRGGAWSSVAGLGIAALFVPLALLSSARARFAWLTRRRALVAGFVLLVLPTTLWNFIPGGTLRQAKVRPALLLVLRELSRSERPKLDPAQVGDAIATYQAHQRERDVRGQWEFVDLAHPLRKHHVGTPHAVAKRPNVIVLQLETFRARDMKSMNGGLEGPAPTPFLDALAAAPNSAAFQRYYASGVPTVFAFMSIHASLLAHPSKSIPYEATHVNIEGFPQLLREHGYHTMHFTGSDPDWDSQRVWLDRWYDEVHFDPSHRERDREVFRAASARIREQASSGAPFLAYVVSISNHAPFRSPEPALSIPGGDTAIDSLHDTMRYTDDVVREFYASIAHEPWFDDTVLIVTGDHGYDLGDRGESGGHQNLRHETTWVPLIVHGKDARLPRGASQCVGSHVDLAPTILELASVWDDNSFMGHSLLDCDPASADAIVLRGGHYTHETREHSLYQPADAAPFVYEGHDLVQAHELSAPPAAVLERAARLARAYETSLVYAVDSDQVAPRMRAQEVFSDAAELP